MLLIELQAAVEMAEDVATRGKPLRFMSKKKFPRMERVMGAMIPRGVLSMSTKPVTQGKWSCEEGLRAVLRLLRAIDAVLAHGACASSGNCNKWQ